MFLILQTSLEDWCTKLSVITFNNLTQVALYKKCNLSQIVLILDIQPSKTTIYERLHDCNILFFG